MPLLAYLEPGDDFPPTSDALAYPNGLLAAGGELNSETLLAAYRRGIFPWYEEPQPVLWWTPNPRSVLFLNELHVSRSLRRFLRNTPFTITADTVFADVLMACAAPREDQQGTWIGSAMQRAYQRLHEQRWAHSVEVWRGDGDLVGGLYGIAIGGAFFGESMFSRADNASKMALAALVARLRNEDFDFIDCQVESEHLNSLGARNLSRLDFEDRLQQTVVKETRVEAWHVIDNGPALAKALR